MGEVGLSGKWGWSMTDISETECATERAFGRKEKKEKEQFMKESIISIRKKGRELILGQVETIIKVLLPTIFDKAMVKCTG